MSTDVIDGDNVWMVQRCDSLGFLLEAVQTIGVFGKCSRQNFDGNVAVQPFITRAIHLTHSAFTNLRTDFIPTEFYTGLQRGTHWRAL